MKKLFAIFLASQLWINLGFCQSNDQMLTDLSHTISGDNFSEYQQYTALYLAQLSELVYWDSSTIDKFHNQFKEKYPTQKVNYRTLEYKNGNTHAQALLWCTDSFLVIAFRGTEPSKLGDWMTNASFWVYLNTPESNDEFANMPPGHGGFRRSLIKLMTERKLLSVAKSLIQETVPQKNDSSWRTVPVYLTGHSLGAAISQLCIEPLNYSGFLFSGAYHFAPPLAIACSEREYMRGKYGNVVYDIVNYKDFVPRAGRFSTAHFGKFYRICDDGLLYKEEEEYVEFNFLEFKTEFKLHSLKTHIKLLRKEANANNEVLGRSKGKPFPCMELKIKPRNLCEMN